MLNNLGKRAQVLGNIGIPVTETAEESVDFYIIETSSYQAANFSSTCRIAVLTSLFPEHLDWHGSLEQYYRDKSNLLLHSDVCTISATALRTLEEHNIDIGYNKIIFGQDNGWHCAKDIIYNQAKYIGKLQNEFLTRAHNQDNVCAVMSVIDILGLDTETAITAMASYKSLPHRQQEIGEIDGILFVDDSISTTPQSAIAAIETHSKRPITLIVGGFDRGLDYTPLIDYLESNHLSAVVCLGESGSRIFDELTQRGMKNVHSVSSMIDAVAVAKKLTPNGGTILLSPAAPSYGMFSNYIDRANHFIKASGFTNGL